VVFRTTFCFGIYGQCSFLQEDLQIWFTRSTIDLKQTLCNLKGKQQKLGTPVELHALNLVSIGNSKKKYQENS
jgi:hypothetical protein